ncbi:MAG: PTS glucose transporter subunit IIA [Campylobacterota bacterium]|nr:PTS glucose transporter subunit IIA [Campylobacterota bacterium]
MFGLFKRKSIDIVAPVAGEIVMLSSVNDEVFSQKMVGDGIAIVPTDGLFCSPIDGEVSRLFPTKHAYVVKHNSGVEVMVHIGLNTVSLDGDGFTAVVSEGDSVKAGDLIVKTDLEKIITSGRETITPVIISEMANYKIVEKKSGVVTKDDPVLEVK